MKLLLYILVWLVVFLFFPIIALAALVLFPVVWLLSLPLRVLGIVIDSILELLKAVLLLPARLLGARPAA